jgi:excisionase family DNA binding protein
MAVLQAGHDEVVLTLGEAAAFLRVPEDAVLALADKDALPAQKIGEEWRFLKRALADWLHDGPGFYRELKRYPAHWLFGYPPMEDLVMLLEQRILSRIAASTEKTPKAGSKEAILKHFGVFRDDDDMEARLAEARAQREAGE